MLCSTLNTDVHKYGPPLHTNLHYVCGPQNDIWAISVSDMRKGIEAHGQVTQGIMGYLGVSDRYHKKLHILAIG